MTTFDEFQDMVTNDPIVFSIEGIKRERKYRKQGRRVERCAKCGTEDFTSDYLVEGEVLAVCDKCVAQIPNARPVGDDESPLISEE